MPSIALQQAATAAAATAADANLHEPNEAWDGPQDAVCVAGPAVFEIGGPLGPPSCLLLGWEETAIAGAPSPIVDKYLSLCP